MTERDPKAIAKHCRAASERTDLPEAHREMLAGYARFYQSLVEQSEKEAGRLSDDRRGSRHSELKPAAAMPRPDGRHPGGLEQGRDGRRGWNRSGR